MNKNIAKTVEYLKRYIGKEIIRTKPATYKNGNTDNSYMGEPSILIGFTNKGEIICETKYYGKHTLPIAFTDRFWITLKKAIQKRNNKLNEFVDKKIKRIKPVIYPNGIKYDEEHHTYVSPTQDDSYMDNEGVLLVSASKHHIIIKNKYNRIIILNDYFANPNDWILA